MGEAIKQTIDELSILSLSVSDIELTAEISDGRKVSIPLAWFPRLLQANQDQLKNYELSPDGYGAHWPDVDEDISVRAFVG